MSDGRSTEKTAADGRSQGTFSQPSLRSFVSGVAGQVIISLGLVKNPATGRVERSLPQAKYSIDLLQILHDKMKGNLTDEEEQFFGAVLYDLRMRYVEACR